MFFGKGSVETTLETDDIRQLLAQTFDALSLDGRRVLVIIPDGTRTAPIPLMFRLLYEEIGTKAARLDYLIALGTHPPMSEPAIDALVGVPAAERAARYPGVHIVNHRWDDPAALETLGVISGQEMAQLTGDLVVEETPVRLNRLVDNYDQLILCGPTLPHEAAGFSGGAKYLFPGIAGAEITNAIHWLCALATNLKTTGIKDTATRRLIHRAAESLRTPILCLALVLKDQALHGLYCGSHLEAWSAAADLSARLNIISVERPFKRVLALLPTMYEDLWTGGKGMYKTEPAIADGGEVILYAPHLTEVSYTHGALLDRVGYHVIRYFLGQRERFHDIPHLIMAHSSYVKGIGAFDVRTGLETPRIQVTLATGIPKERCDRINLGYADYREIDPDEWKGREAEGILVVPHAGEVLYRAR
jgi:nickel-dependent lactate racemase